MKRLTTSVFIERAKAILGEGYTFEKTEYKTAKELVEIHCDKHGPFDITPSNVMSGKGCAKCGSSKRGLKEREQAALEFPTKVFDKHGDKYDCSKAKYVNYKTKVEIVCKIDGHGSFFTSPRIILGGHGCPKCSAEYRGSLSKRTTEEFIAESRQLSGDRYGYDKVVYEHSMKKVNLFCFEKGHGDFFVTPANHIHNRIGCPKCVRNGYNEAKRGALYVLKSGNQTKVGITNLSADSRVKNIRHECGKEFSVVAESWFDDGSVTRMIETKLLFELRSVYKNPSKEFVGYTETFLDVNLPALLSRIQELIEEHSNAPNRLNVTNWEDEVQAR